MSGAQNDPGHALDWPSLDRHAGSTGLFVRRTMADFLGTARRSLTYVATPYGLDEAHRAALVPGRMRREMWALADLTRALAETGITAIVPALSLDLMVRTARSADLDRGVWVRPILQSAAQVLIPALPGRDVSHDVWADAWTAIDSNTPVFWIEEDAS
ncbi:hypothetical protein LX81_00258 [Palleronia aestuarii]|uniref:Uncharacterized protein n=1 Tax=Palleronia aestuarii TaxID=568105 RepID=A0A2W7P2Z3_9RHOB|nr:hypothetical protein [Palleronia aestuarii]PZX19796.1 hypothetical protein LX81_00258 [Palleronia aestuarii]